MLARVGSVISRMKWQNVLIIENGFCCFENNLLVFFSIK